MARVNEITSAKINNTIANVRTWSDLFLNVKDFGARGDGETDDTDAIQETIDHALDVGKKALLFPAGTYKVTSLTDLAEVILFGDGAAFDGIVDDINQVGFFISPAQLVAFTEDLETLETEFDNHEANTSNPHSVTKSQVGLNNVDNVQQAAKTDFDNLENQLESTSSGNSGAHHVGSAPISGVSGANVFLQLESLKNSIDETATGTIPDGSLEDVKLSDDAGNIKSNFSNHESNTSNPHSVTAGQVGAPTEASFNEHVAENLQYQRRMQIGVSI